MISHTSTSRSGRGPRALRRAAAALILLLAAQAPALATTSAWQRATEAMQKADWAGAVSAYTEHLAEVPTDAWSWYAMGSVLHGMERFDEAVTAFESSLEHQVGVPGLAHYNLACSYARVGNADKALEHLAEAAPSTVFEGKRLLEDPDLAGLRGNPRFAELAREADLAHHPCLIKDEYRAFDFWLGTWDVKIPAGFKAATDVVEKSEDGCVITQTWNGTIGTFGRSYTFFDAARETWVNTWVGRAGGVATIEGGPKGGDVVLEGPGTTGPDSRTRVTWKRLGEDRIDVITEGSADAGKTWSPAGHLSYHRADG